MSGWRAWTIELVAWAVVGVVLGAVGPFGSFFNDVLIVRVGYWLALSLVSGLMIGIAVRWTSALARRRRLGAWAWVPVLAILLTVVAAPVARLMAVALWPRLPAHVGWLEWVGQAFLLELAFLSIYVAVRSRLAPSAPIPSPGDATILKQLPARLGRDVICLQMEDHYVRIHTPRGSTLVLSPLGRAIAAVGDLEGLQVHRSWWVARHAVERVVYEGRNLKLRLTGGIEAPVARNQVARLKAAGWLDQDGSKDVSQG
jgi:DNA-binding LytR/AlgR family response regulator